MNAFALSLLTSYSIAIPAFCGLIRYRNSVLSYRPFLILCCLGLISEVVSYLCAVYYHTNAIPFNIFTLVEVLCYTWLFRNWGGFKKDSYFHIYMSMLVVAWLLDNFILSNIQTINSPSRILFFFFLIFLAINQVNKILLQHRGLLLRDSRFLICAGIIIFYSYSVTTEIFYVLNLNFSDLFYNRVHAVLEWVNVLVNLIFTIAILWIPRRQKFMLPF